jgi:medium-chain acyl-[acyl-carrier-protein] hydrolase
MEREPVWWESFRIRSSEVGAGGRLAPAPLCALLQEAASNHAEHLGWSLGQLAGEGLTWVLARLAIQVRRMPRWREEVRLATWPSGVDGALARRDFRLIGEDGGEAAVAGSGWVLLDLARRRPVRPPEEIEAMARTAPAPVVAPAAPVAPMAMAEPVEVVPRLADLDLNRHVNNVAIVALLLEGAGEDLLAGELERLDVEFRAEARAGERLLLRTGAEAGGLLHQLVRAGDGREVARAASSWRQKKLTADS